MILRDYQNGAIEETHDRILDGYKRILIHSGTGTGKTVIAAEITKRAVALGNEVLFLAHRKELIDQAHAKLASFGVDAGVMMADDKRHAPWKKVCVASVPTIVRREHKPKAKIIWIDECHRSPSNSYLEILEAYPDAVVLGLTATPIRTDGRGLGEIFEAMVSCPSVGDMMRRIDPSTGKPYLVGTRVFAPPSVDLSGVGVAHGDYKPDELAAVCDKPKLVGDIVTHWLKLAGGAQTVVFAAGIEHSKHIVAEFTRAGVRAEHLDGTTPRDLRAAILAQLASGETTVVSNVGVLTEGWDCPIVACVVLARPTKSVGLFLQMVGRILRPYPGKILAIILDHAGCHHEHGFVDDERDWRLTKDQAKITNASVSVQTCDQSVMNCSCGCPHTAEGTHRACYATFRSGPDECPYCGCPLLRKSREMDQVDGSLVELQRPLIEVPVGIRVAQMFQDLIDSRNSPDQRNQLQFFLNLAARKNYASGWARHQFIAKYGAPPPAAWMPREWRESHQ